MPTINTELLNFVLSGKIHGNKKYNIEYISIDSRIITEPASTCFFAIKGARNDGHDYLQELVRRGVKIFVVSQLPEELKTTNDLCFIKVFNTLEALQKLAQWKREQFNFPVVGITGSNGKTIIKEWLFELLQKQQAIVRNPKSYNSQVGVPLSVWLMNESYQLGIFEAGISQLGEMQKLAKIIQPTIGILTNIGEAHQENFSSLEEKTKQKLELFRSAETIIYCSDHLLPAQLINQYFKEKNCIGWSFSDTSASIFINTDKKKEGTTFNFSYQRKNYSCFAPLTDNASIENMAHCLVVAASQNLLTNEVIKQVGSIKTVAMRLELKDGINQCELINDYYNSDINSLAIALNFQSQQNVSSNRNKSLILSDIQQSGKKLHDLYTEVGRMLSAHHIDRLIGIGSEISAHKNCFRISSTFYKDTDEFLNSFSPSAFKNEIILLKGARSFHFERISSALQRKYHQTVLEVNLNQLVDNLNFYRSQLRSGTKIVIMVKAFSYGSGSTEIASILQYQHVDYLAVAVADEGIELRRAGIELPIIVMNPEEHSFESMIEFRLEPNVYSLDLYYRFSEAVARNAASHYPIHIKVETGMNRLGFSVDDEIEKLGNSLAVSKTLKVASIFSHLAGADNEGHDAFTHQQVKVFEQRTTLLCSKLDYKVARHLLNSAGIERFPEYQFEMVRLGIGLYGISACNDARVQPISCLKTTVSLIKKVHKGETIGYNRKGKATHDLEIAILPIGYADGYNRRLSNGNGKVYIKGKRAPIIGNICMDMCMVDVTNMDVKEGDKVELFGKNIKLSELADWIGTIPYEILTSISQRVKRVYVQE